MAPIPVPIDQAGVFGETPHGLDWILPYLDEVDIVLYHPELPCLTKEELDLYIRALDSLVKRWRLEVEHNLHVYFSRGDEERVVLCLNK